MKRNLYSIYDVIVDIDEVIAIHKDNWDIVHIYFKNGIEIKSSKINYVDLETLFIKYNSKGSDKE